MSAVPAALPAEESHRVAALHSLRVLDSLPEQVFDDIVLLASQICGTPIGLVSLVDSERQWFKARVGMAAAETHRDLAFCAHAILAPDEVFVVEDAATDPRFSGNPLVTGNPRIRFYAGAPVVLPGGGAMGTVCVIDTVPRALTEAQLAALQALSRQATALLELRHRNLAAEKHARELTRLSDLLSRMGGLAKVGGWEIELATREITWTEEVYRIHDLLPGTPLDLDSGIGFYAPSSQLAIRSAVDEALEHGTPYDLELTLITASGKPRTVRTQGEVEMVEGRPRRLFGAFQDVTESRAVEQAAIDSQRRLRLITDNLPALVAYIDKEERYRFLSAHIQRIYGTDTSGGLGRSMRETRGEAVYGQLAPHVRLALRGEKASFVYTDTFDGAERHFQAHYVPDVDPRGEVQGFYAMTFDITALHETQRQLEKLAHVDALTGLPNRRQFDERIARALLRSRRSGQPLAVMFLDIDHFKLVNDALGHAGGDTVLCEFARRLKACVRATDTVARLAGDEFVVLLEGVRELPALAEKVVECVRSPFQVEGTTLAVSTSVGVASCGGESSAAEVLARADAALYEAKRGGRDRYSIA